ncbi:hypothetical protein J437_LFUL011861 [Ladona fulva]|uniref:NHR domain-containing protein n=1 Tax=Ladona fulva TaxID=123851 RepID=A0A8K0KH72_LADFU|nr:hypothetical protein J437_LFUL011861 [Ladona fulva]
MDARNWPAYVLLGLIFAGSSFTEDSKGRTPLRFHSRSAHNMIIGDDGFKAFRKTNRAFGHTAALTIRTLEPGEVFEVFLESTEYVENPRIGVTTHSPDSIQYPDYMNHLRSGTWGWDVYPNEVYQDGEVIKEPYPAEERTIKRGDTFGVVVKPEGSLHFYHNGVDLGEAANELFGKYYGYIDLYWGGSNATIFNFEDFLQ